MKNKNFLPSFFVRAFNFRENHKKNPRAFLCVFLSIFVFIQSTNAELVSSDKFGWTIDFPEYFILEDATEDERSALFSNQIVPVQVVIRVYEQSRYNDAASALKSTLLKLSASAQDAEIKWRNRDCALAQFTIPQNVLGTSQKGWAVSIPLQDEKSVNYFVILSYAPEENAFDLEQFILSVLDCVMVDRGSFYEAGIITSFAFPKSSEEQVNLKIAGKEIQTKIDKDDSDANQFVVEREFSVFKIYAATSQWQEAWKRFYRIIAKDAFGRMKKPAFDIYTSLMSTAASQNPSNPDAAFSQLLLTWIQDFKYETKSVTADKADFMNIPSVLKNEGSDCDSRALLLMVLLKNSGIDACMFVSVEYSHALLGVFLEGAQGQSYNLDGKDYLFGETTAKGLTLGMIRADMQDRSKWIPVEMAE